MNRLLNGFLNIMSDFKFDDLQEQSDNQREYKLHVEAVDHIRNCFPGLFFFHIPNRPGSGADGHHKKMMGTKKGASDLLFSWNFGRLEIGVIEVKAPGITKESTAQNKFFSSVHILGWRHALCDSKRKIHDTLVNWGHKPLYNTVTEPDYATDAEKKQRAFDMYKR